jgi:signal transduction histidine kinase
VIVQDIEKCDFIQGTEDKDIFLKTGIHACQTTPLLSRNGYLVGMISTQWCDPYEPSERELRLFDVLARQAADIIERKKSEDQLRESELRAMALVEELKRADHSKNEFLNALSHELRNPLATIVAELSLLDLTEDTQKIAQAKEIMQRQINQLCHLVDDLLDITRITNNKIELKKERTELNKLVSSIAEDYTKLFEEKGVAIKTVINMSPIILKADSVRLKQAVGNLLHNALKFTESGGVIHLSVYQEQNEAVIRVKDNGIGINPDFLPNLYEPFKQADKSLDRRDGGLGLGLSIVKGITQLHGGSVSAASDGLGKGSKFRIRLPLCDDKLKKDVAE